MVELTVAVKHHKISEMSDKTLQILKLALGCKSKDIENKGGERQLLLTGDALSGWTSVAT